MRTDVEVREEVVQEALEEDLEALEEDPEVQEDDTGIPSFVFIM